MSHEPKSPSLGMISTATRTTATVSPLTPSPLNGSIVANGSPAAQSAHSGFAAALRKLAKQAEEPRGRRNVYRLGTARRSSSVVKNPQRWNVISNSSVCVAFFSRFFVLKAVALQVHRCMFVFSSGKKDKIESVGSGRIKRRGMKRE
ncbi:genetic suppressor element 1 isoform X3 [Tachysurus ichikawai]